MHFFDGAHCHAGALHKIGRKGLFHVFHIKFTAQNNKLCSKYSTFSKLQKQRCQFTPANNCQLSNF